MERTKSPVQLSEIRNRIHILSFLVALSLRERSDIGHYGVPACVGTVTCFWRLMIFFLISKIPKPECVRGHSEQLSFFDQPFADPTPPPPPRHISPDFHSKHIIPNKIFCATHSLGPRKVYQNGLPKGTETFLSLDFKNYNLKCVSGD